MAGAKQIIRDIPTAQAQAMVELGLPQALIAATFNTSRQTLYMALRK